MKRATVSKTRSPLPPRHLALRRACSEALEPRHLLAAVPVAPLQLAEILTPPDANRAVAEVNGKVYFSYADWTYGRREFWSYDSASRQAARLFTNPSDRIGGFTPSGGALFFTSARTAANSFEGVYLRNGANSGYVTLAQSGNTSFSVPPAQVTPFGDHTFFIAPDDFNRATLVRTDGIGISPRRDVVYTGNAWNVTAAQSAVYFTDGGLWKVPAGAASATKIFTGKTRDGATYVTEGRNVLAVGDTVYFTVSGTTPSGGFATWLYASGGTPETTRQVAVIKPGGLDSQSLNFAAAGDTLFFTARDDQGFPSLWKSDGTAEGTRLVKSFDSKTTWPGPFTASPTTGRLAFVAPSADYGVEVWTSDGTPDGTRMLRDVQPGPGTSAPSDLHFVGSTLYFAAVNQDDGAELWSSDGTPDGTAMVADQYPGPGGSSPRDLFVSGTGLYYVATDPAAGFSLMQIDAPGVLPRVVADPTPGLFSPPIRRVAGLDGSLLFAAGDGSYAGREFWRSDGTPAGTGLVKDIHPNTATGSFPENFYLAGHTILFSATNTASGTELWTTDGTPDGTQIFKEFSPSTGSTRFGGFSRDGNDLYFEVSANGSAGSGLWKSNGTADGTVKVTTQFTGALARIGGSLYYLSGQDLYRFDSTTSIYHFSSSAVRAFLAIGDRLYITANNGSGLEPFVSNGTTSGTLMLADISPGGGSSLANGFTAVSGGKVVFFAAAADGKYRLYVTNGTPAGTTLLKDVAVNAPSLGNGVFWIFQAGGVTYFTADDGANGIELWKTDGTPQGTTLVKNINPSGSSTPDNPAVVNGRLYFAADDGAHGRELWTSDGTAEGTFRLTDINPGPGASLPTNLTDVNGVLYFTANDGAVPTLFKIAPPVARAGGPYRASPGAPVPLDASASSGIDPSEALSYTWDLDGDGMFGETGPGASRGDETGPRPTFVTAGLPDGNYALSVRVTDPTGLSSSALATLTVGQLPGLDLAAGATYVLSSAAALPRLTLSGGPATITIDLGQSFPNLRLTLGPSAHLTLAADQHLSDLVLIDDATMNLGTHSLAIASPTDVSALLHSIASASAGGRWTGPGITSSPAASDTSRATGVGYYDDGTTLTLRRTYYGDANLDGSLSADDVATILLAQSQNRTDWQAGNFNYDTRISPDDWALFAQGAAYSGAPPAPATFASEPRVRRIAEELLG